VAFTPFGEVLVVTLMGRTLTQFSVVNGVLSTFNLTQILNLGNTSAASVAFANGVEVLVVTAADGTLDPVQLHGIVINLTQFLGLTTPDQSATVKFNPFNGQEVLMVTGRERRGDPVRAVRHHPHHGSPGAGPLQDAAPAFPPPAARRWCRSTRFGDLVLFIPPVPGNS